MIIVAVLATYCVSLISGHAVMTNPVAWNPSPSKASPCGGGNAIATVAGTFQEGATIQVGWRVVAGDGNGPVTLAFAPVATPTTFTITGIATSPAPVATGPYTLTATLPATLTAGTYTMQAQSSTGWFSCSTVSITKTAQPATNPGTTPVVASNCLARPNVLGFCSILAQPSTGVKIEISGNPALSNMVNYDTTVNTVFQANMQSTKVFGNAGANTACADAYKRFLCAYEFPICGNTKGGVCKSACYAMSAACDLQDSHKDLYDCASIQETGADSVGTCAPCTGACALTLGAGSQISYSIAVLVSLFAALVAARNL
jgi:hypothetical protein